jgi:hypothetical protein
VDGRYIVGAIVIVMAAGLWQAMLHTHSSFAWSLPFAVILLFLAVTGESPGKRAVHWMSDPPLH